MINVSRDRLRQVEYLIQQSLQGNHVLFDSETLHRALSQEVNGAVVNAPLITDDAYSVEPHIERILECVSLDEKRAYLESLDPRLVDQVVRTYFHIVENDLYDRLSERSLREGEVRH